MFQRDHIMRQIGLLSRAIARVLSLRAENRELEALKEIDRTLQDLSTGVEPNHPGFQDLSAMGSTEIRDIVPFAFDLATLLTLKGDLLAASGQTTVARECYLQALHISELALRESAEALPWDIHDRIDGLRERLQDVGMEP